jgi:hypothetical protein
MGCIHLSKGEDFHLFLLLYPRRYQVEWYFNRDVTDINSPSMYVLDHLACSDYELLYERIKVLGGVSSLQSSNLVT